MINHIIVSQTQTELKSKLNLIHVWIVLCCFMFKMLYQKSLLLTESIVMRWTNIRWKEFWRSEGYLHEKHFIFKSI